MIRAFSGQILGLALPASLLVVPVLATAYVDEIENAVEHGPGGVVATTGFVTNEREEIAGALVDLIGGRYPREKPGEAMATRLKNDRLAGVFDKATTRDDFCVALENSWSSVHEDAHLQIRFVPAGGGPRTSGGARNPRQPGSKAPIPEAKMLDGDVGYLGMDVFREGEEVEAALASAIGLFSEARAIVVDLRDSPGGEAETSHLLQPYFVPPETHLMTLYTRARPDPIEIRTPADLPTTPLINCPLYLLVSSKTASAAEGVAYGLQQFWRATIIGETTFGAAHMSRGVRLEVADDDGALVGEYRFLLPIVLSEHPKSGTNWEGVGVVPDIEVPANEALDRALAEVAKR